MEPSNAHRYLHKITLILLPHLAQTAGRRRQQAAVDVIDRDPAIAYRLDVGEGHVGLVMQQQARKFIGIARLNTRSTGWHPNRVASRQQQPGHHLTLHGANQTLQHRGDARIG